jgi:hypothetical protein
MSDEICECPECRHMREAYSDHPEVNAAVHEMMLRFEADPWSNPPFAHATVAGIRAVIKVGWGKRWADDVRLTVH